MTEIFRAALYANAAYSPHEFAGAAREYNKRFSSTTFYYIPANEIDDCNWIIFKGTSEIPDIFVDMAAVPWRYLGNWVHAGFAYAHPKKQLRKILKRLPGKKLRITGHSLAGALSELTHLLVQREFPEIDCKTITFGKPRAFKKPSRVRFKKDSILSVVSCSDLVTRLPRYLFTYGCKNQNMLYLCKNGDAYLNPDKEFVEKDFKVTRAFADHGMSNYLDRVRDIQ